MGWHRQVGLGQKQQPAPRESDPPACPAAPVIVEFDRRLVSSRTQQLEFHRRLLSTRKQQHSNLQILSDDDQLHSRFCLPSPILATPHDGVSSAELVQRSFALESEFCGVLLVGLRVSLDQMVGGFGDLDDV
eukprot:1696969-Rhodomonas_salina.5